MIDGNDLKIIKNLYLVENSTQLAYQRVECWLESATCFTKKLRQGQQKTEKVCSALK